MIPDDQHKSEITMKADWIPAIVAASPSRCISGLYLMSPTAKWDTHGDETLLHEELEILL
jgi:hypothetical protein